MSGATAKFALIPFLAAILAPAQSLPSNPDQKLSVTVTDENAAAVVSARVQLQGPPPTLPLRCQTNFAGRCEFTNLPAESYELRVDKIGFYEVVLPRVQPTANVDVTLFHQQETREVVNVVESVPVIDPAQVSSKEELTGAQIIDIPYPGSHDYRGALAFVPGVTPGGFGEPHVNGAHSYQTMVLLDGFNVSEPVNGGLDVRTSVESFRTLEIQGSREPAEYGKGSGGVLSLNTRMGDDHFRVTSIDFIPGIQTIKGVSIGQWTPIFTVSGPIQKGKVWFIDALDGEYDNDIITQLPSGADNDHAWRVDNLAKVQANLTNHNLLTASFLSNYYHDQYSGLSFLQPQATTSTDAETAYFGSLKDQYYFPGGALLETGFAVTQYSSTLTPQGIGPYIKTTGAAAGNYYLHQNAASRRTQGLANFYLAPRQWHGRHDIKVGTDLDRLTYAAEFLRQPISFLRAGEPPPGQQPEPCATNPNGVPLIPSSCARYSDFSGGNSHTIYNFETSAYAQDRWLITNRLLIEPGIRLDWDELVRTPLFSSRLAGTYIFDDEGNTKLSAGIGIIYDATNLGVLHQPFDGQRVDYFFDAKGNPTDENGNPAIAPVPVPSTFTANTHALAEPRFLNWSVGLEKKLPAAIFMKVEFLQKRGTHGFAYTTLNGALSGNYQLGNQREDHYDALEISARHNFRKRYEIFGAYTYSRARTNQAFDFSLDFPLLSPQLPGPYAWDVPNRFVGWGTIHIFKMPIVHAFDLVYSTEARTGQPFNVTTDQGVVPAAYPPGTFRLPTYFTLNLQAEKRFRLFGYYWALRGGFDNITNHPNSSLANGVIDASHPSPTYIDNPGRAFTGRIRFLGKK